MCTSFLSFPLAERSGSRRFCSSMSLASLTGAIARVGSRQAADLRSFDLHFGPSSRRGGGGNAVAVSSCNEVVLRYGAEAEAGTDQ